MVRLFMRLAVALIAAVLSVTAVAEEKTEKDLAQELTNPVADLMTIPIQLNVDDNIGLNDKGRKTTLNIQPVIPFQVNEDLNLITRTIVPVIRQDDIVADQGCQSGLGDINVQLFFSPRNCQLLHLWLSQQAAISRYY